MNNLNIISREELIKIHSMIESIQKNFTQEDIAFRLKIDDYYLQAKALNPQQYGLAIQKHFSTLLGYETLPSSLDRGDFLTTENEYVEFKTSYIDQFSKFINIKHIRLWQKLDWFYVFVIFISESYELEYKLFKLTKEQMSEECLLNNATSTNMTKNNHQSNINVEVGFSIEVGSPAYKRWEEKYFKENFDIKSLSEKRLKQLSNYDEREKVFLEIERRNIELEEKLLELYKKCSDSNKEERNPIDVIYFCIENNIKLDNKQSRMLAFMKHDGLVDLPTFKKHYSIHNLLEHEKILLNEFRRADSRKSRRGKITKKFLANSGISAYIQSEYGEEIERRLVKQRKSKYED